MKSKILAAILNLIPGLGYLYLGRRRKFAILLIAGFLLGGITVFDPALAYYLNRSDFTVWDTISLASVALMGAAFVYDAYCEALQMREAVDTRERVMK